MMSLSKERKERRLQSYDGMTMTRRGYNAVACYCMALQLTLSSVSILRMQ
jgi:hypothetical protein